MRYYWIAAAWLFLAASGLTAATTGPKSKLYIIAPYDKLYVLQGNTLEQSWRAIGKGPIVVEDTVRLMGVSRWDSGAEYTLNGTHTGTNYAFPTPLYNDRFYDGTTDGQYNYSWGYDSAAAWRFDRNWQNPVRLFTLDHCCPR